MDTTVGVLCLSEHSMALQNVLIETYGSDSFWTAFVRRMPWLVFGFIGVVVDLSAAAIYAM